MQTCAGVEVGNQRPQPRNRHPALSHVVGNPSTQIPCFLVTLNDNRYSFPRKNSFCFSHVRTLESLYGTGKYVTSPVVLLTHRGARRTRRYPELYHVSLSTTAIPCEIVTSARRIIGLARETASPNFFTPPHIIQSHTQGIRRTFDGPFRPAIIEPFCCYGHTHYICFKDRPGSQTVKVDPELRQDIL